jgi:MtaA/CmuA family methyltransferase
MNCRELVFGMMDHLPVDRIPLMPITMKFAANQIGVKYGAYLSDFRLLVEAQLQTARKFNLAQVSCISDSTREAGDLGAVVRFFEDQPPAIDESEPLLAQKITLAGLKIPDPLGGGRMHDRVKAVALLKEKIAGERIVEGWIEGPCGQAANLRGIDRLMQDFKNDPIFVYDLLEFIVEMELRFAKAQKEAGVDLMGVGDTTASLVDPAIFEQFISPAHKKLVKGLKSMGLRTRSHMRGNSKRILKFRGELGYDIVDVDAMVPLADARLHMPDQIILGNISTFEVLRDGSVDDVLAAVAKCHDDAGSLYIIGCGCEVPRETPNANLFALREYAGLHRPGDTQVNK